LVLLIIVLPSCSVQANPLLSLQVAVRLPNKTTIHGILGLYDKYIAIVTSLGFQSVSPLDMYKETDLPDAPMMVAAGRAYKSCSLMGITGELTDAPIGVDYEDLLASTCQITEVTVNFLSFLVEWGI
jgi:hypothetical protein